MQFLHRQLAHHGRITRVQPRVMCKISYVFYFYFLVLCMTWHHLPSSSLSSPIHAPVCLVIQLPPRPSLSSRRERCNHNHHNPIAATTTDTRPTMFSTARASTTLALRCLSLSSSQSQFLVLRADFPDSGITILSAPRRPHSLHVQGHGPRLDHGRDTCRPVVDRASGPSREARSAAAQPAETQGRRRLCPVRTSLFSSSSSSPPSFSSSPPPSFSSSPFLTLPFPTLPPGTTD